MAWDRRRYCGIVEVVHLDGLESSTVANDHCMSDSSCVHIIMRMTLEHDQKDHGHILLLGQINT